MGGVSGGQPEAAPVGHGRLVASLHPDPEVVECSGEEVPTGGDQGVGPSQSVLGNRFVGHRLADSVGVLWSARLMNSSTA